MGQTSPISAVGRPSPGPGGARDGITQPMAVTRYHFISGLPDSGAEELARLLAQNPRFVTGSDTGADALFGAAMRRMQDDDCPESRLDEQQCRALLRATLDAVHHDRQAGAVVFDNAPGWLGYIDALGNLFPLARFVVMVRDPADLGGSTARGARLDTPLRHLQSALAGAHAQRILVIEHERFLSDPVTVLDVLYHFLREHEFDHDLAPVSDAGAGTADAQPPKRRLLGLMPGRRGGGADDAPWRKEKSSAATILIDTG